MNIAQSEWAAFKQTYKACPRNRRYHLQPRLEEVIRNIQVRGEAVPAEARQLHKKLVDEAIEAQFDNMPV